MPHAYSDRSEAGRTLASYLQPLQGQPGLMVLALPRGGVPVAHAVATALGAPLDVLVVRKLGLPQQPEVAMGAMATGGACVLDSALINSCRVTAAAIDAVRQREHAELQRRESVYRAGKPPLVVTGQPVILVDDGLATGATMEAALLALRSLHPSRIIVAVPVASKEAAERLSPLADELVCPLIPADFMAVGRWYRDFRQTSDAEVLALLADPLLIQGKENRAL